MQKRSQALPHRDDRDHHRYSTDQRQQHKTGGEELGEQAADQHFALLAALAHCDAPRTRVRDKTDHAFRIAVRDRDLEQPVAHREEAYKKCSGARVGRQQGFSGLVGDNEYTGAMACLECRRQVGGQVEPRRAIRADDEAAGNRRDLCLQRGVLK